MVIHGAAKHNPENPMKRPCKYPGCRELLPRNGYCEEHASWQHNARKDYDAGTRASTPALAAAAKFRSSRAWKRARRAKLSENPLCEDPHGDHARRNDTATAREVHHIQGLATHPELALSWANLMSLCAKCHAKIEAEVRKE